MICAHSVPDCYESLDRLVSFGQLSMAAMNDAQPFSFSELGAKVRSPLDE